MNMVTGVSPHAAFIPALPKEPMMQPTDKQLVRGIGNNFDGLDVSVKELKREYLTKPKPMATIYTQKWKVAGAKLICQCFVRDKKTDMGPAGVYRKFADGYYSMRAGDGVQIVKLVD